MAKTSTREAFTRRGLPRARFLNEAIANGSIDMRMPTHPLAFGGGRFRIESFRTTNGQTR